MLAIAMKSRRRSIGGEAVHAVTIACRYSELVMFDSSLVLWYSSFFGLVARETLKVGSARGCP